MQASVHTFDPLTSTGSVILDTGKVVPFGGHVFERSGLRHLRVGQRLSIEVDGDPEGESTQLSRLWIVGIGADEPIR
jgi:cold shock CspA family protein